MRTESEIREMIKILEFWDSPNVLREQARALRWALGEDVRSPFERLTQGDIREAIQSS